MTDLGLNPTEVCGGASCSLHGQGVDHVELSQVS